MSDKSVGLPPGIVERPPEPEAGTTNPNCPKCGGPIYYGSRLREDRYQFDAESGKHEHVECPMH